jgi:hypothetical protein
MYLVNCKNCCYWYLYYIVASKGRKRNCLFTVHVSSILYLTTESKIKMSKLKTKIEKSQNTFIVIAIAIQDSICCQRKVNIFLFITKQPSLFTSFACHQKKVVVWK